MISGMFTYMKQTNLNNNSNKIYLVQSLLCLTLPYMELPGIHQLLSLRGHVTKMFKSRQSVLSFLVGH